MNKARKVTASGILALLMWAMWTSVGWSQDQGVPRRSPEEDARAKATTPPEAPAKRSTMRVEEKLVRDVYARLMRYQTAATDELAARAGKAGSPEDYLTFELQNFHSGPTREISGRPLADLLTMRSGAVLTITPTHLSKGEGPAHAYYEAEWSLMPDGEKTTNNGSLGDKKFAGLNRYTSYEVTARLGGRERTYKALILYKLESDKGTEQEQSTRPSQVKILDNLTSEMNTVFNDESPRIRSPWNKYIKSSLYRAVARTIKETKEAGQPLIPADAPIGYLPGDDVTPSSADNLALMATVNCPDLRILRDSQDITDTTQSVVVGQRINLSLETNPEGEEPSNIQWTIGGNKVANYVPSSTAANPPTALTTLTDPSLSFYWINAGQGLGVSVTATVFGAEVTKYAHFNVAAPSPAEPTVTLPTSGQLYINSLTDCSSGQSGPHLVFGNITGPNCTTGGYSGSAGIRFFPPTTSSLPGNFFFVQLVTGDTIVYSRPNVVYTCTATNTPGLDGNYPYQGRIGQSVEDAPFVPLPITFTNVSREFAATMYLMWQSNTSGSIPVPMGSVGWSISGSTTQPQPNGVWTTPSGSGSAQPFAAANGTSSFPTWTGQVVVSGHCQ